MESAFVVIIIAVGAGLASPIGGLISLWRTPSSLFTSIAVGYAGGVLFGAVAFEMMPKALEIGSLLTSIGRASRSKRSASCPAIEHGKAIEATT